jgi:SAM-dependent methyltransferase
MQSNSVADGISKEAVVWAYRMFLGREPESEEAIQEKLDFCTDIGRLREVFLTSEEFSYHVPRRGNGLGATEPCIEVETTGPAELIDQLYDHVNRSWESMGESDPFWSVITLPEFRGQPTAADIARFFDSGRSTVESMKCALERAGLSLEGRQTCVEFGCGLGRITRWLAPHFSRTIGVDISGPHLSLANKLAESDNVRGVEWLQLPKVEALSGVPEADLIFSVIVLQHNPPPVIDAMLRTFARILRPNGIAYFQVPTYRADYEFRLAEYLRDQVGKSEMEMHVYPQRRIFEVFAEHGIVPVSVVEDGATGYRDGERSNTFIFHKPA